MQLLIDNFLFRTHPSAVLPLVTIYGKNLGIGRDRVPSDQSRLDSTEQRTKIIPRQCTKTDALVVDTLCKTGNFTFWYGLKYPIQVFLHV